LITTLKRGTAGGYALVRMAREPALVVDGVTKTFRRPHEQMHTLKERALHPFRRRTYDGFTAVSDVSFEVGRGEFFGVVGRNGSGKSTLLKLIAGIYRVSAGDIWVKGRMSTFIELGVGFNPDLAARDNVILNGIMLGLTPSEARERYERVIEFAELSEFEDLKLKNYSSGMQVRLAFAVMIQVDADVLLIDEVLAVGDAAFQQKCFDEFSRLRDEGKTIVLVTHDMGAVRRFCHRAMLVDRGRVVEVGDPEHIGGAYLELNFQGGEGAAAGRRHADDPDRHGDGRAELLDLWLQDARGATVDHVAQGDDVVIKAVIAFRAPMEHPSVGLVVEDAEQRAVLACNTLWQQERTGVYRAGDRATMTLRFRNVLAPGRYHLSPAVSSRGSGLELADHRIRWKSFVSTGPLSTGGLVDLDHEMTISPGADREVAPA
jgi:ABC-type polysaccharide/polyol phosphate transport system ATPase subunit